MKLDIYQEISAVQTTVKSANTVSASDLVTTKRSAKTSIVVKDKETVVIGGLIQDQDTDTDSKVPFLGDIPGLGWLFKSTTQTADQDQPADRSYPPHRQGRQKR